MTRKSYSTVLNDPKIEIVLEKLHSNADGQLSSLVLYYLPKLPRVLIDKGIQWDSRNIDFYKDKYISIVSDNIKTFPEDMKLYVEFLQNPANGYRSITLNLRERTEFSVKVR